MIEIMMRLDVWLTLAFSLAFAASDAAAAPAGSKICGVYTSLVDFASRDARQAALNAQPSFLSDKHKSYLGEDNTARVKLAQDCGFDTLFMSIYPLWGKQWWDIPAGRGMIADVLEQAKQHGFRVHLGLSLFNAPMCENPSRFPGASRTIQCDGTRPSWICFHDDRLWDFYRGNVVEMAKLGRDVPDVLDGIYVDPEAYGPECYLCFCDNCVEKFNKWRGADEAAMPPGLVKPDEWLHVHGLWDVYVLEWHAQEVRRHAVMLREAIHAIDPSLQLSSLLWDYPVAVGQQDARAQYFQMLAIGLGTRDKPSWTLPEHCYYSDAQDLARIIRQVEHDIIAAGAADQVRVLPGIRLLRRDAASLHPRGAVIRDTDVPGYWLYELADVGGKQPIDFEGELVEPAENYIKALREMNEDIRRAESR